MTTDRITVITSVISEAVAAYRKREGLTRAEFAEECRKAGAPETWTATVVGHLETGRRSTAGRRREVSVDELVPIAKAMGTTPLAVLGEHAAAFGGDEPVPCPSCTSGTGVMATTVRADLAKLGDLGDLEPTLAAAALVLAEAIDSGADALPRLTKELRATLEQIMSSRRGVENPDDDDDDFDDDLDAPE